MAQLPRIFISYKRADKRYTERLAKVLNRIYGNDAVWFDDDMFGGQQWWDEITRQIINRDVFIYLLSREAMESVYCRTEFSVARGYQRLIVPVVVRQGRYPDEVRKFQLILQSTSENELVVETLAEILAAINHATGIPPPYPPSRSGANANYSLLRKMVCAPH
jgi:hypothetical protein